MPDPRQPDPARCTCTAADVATGHSIRCPEKATAERWHAWADGKGVRGA